MTEAGREGAGVKRCDNGHISTSPPTIISLFDN